MDDYFGLYGKGYKDKQGTLYLNLGDPGEFLVREKNKNNKYNVGVIIKDTLCKEKFRLLSIVENLSLKEWRKLFLEFHTGEGKNKLEKIIQTSLNPYPIDFPWETAYIYFNSDGSSYVEFPIPAPPNEMAPEFDFL